MLDLIATSFFITLILTPSNPLIALFWKKYRNLCCGDFLNFFHHNDYEICIHYSFHNVIQLDYFLTFVELGWLITDIWYNFSGCHSDRFIAWLSLFFLGLFNNISTATLKRLFLKRKVLNPIILENVNWKVLQRNPIWHVKLYTQVKEVV